MKEFCNKFSSIPITNIRFFKTNKFKYNIYESQSGLKFIMLSSNEDFDYAEILEQIYIGPFIELI